MAAVLVPHLSPSHRLHVRDRTSKLEYLVDSGSDFSVLPPRYSRFHQTNKPKPMLSLFGANNSEIKTYGYETHTVDFGPKRKFEWTFIVADVDRPIIGADFLYEHDLIPDLRRRRLLAGDCQVLGILRKAQTTSVHMLGDSEDKFTQLVKSYPSLVRPTPFNEKPKHDVVHYIETKGPPVYAKPRRLQRAIFKLAKKEFQEMLKFGIIRPSKSAWAAPLLIRPKRDGGIRPCGDYRQLNAITTPDQYPMPNINDVPPKLTAAKIFSVIDVVKAFYHIPVNPADIEKTAVTTPFGLFEFCCMPFGLKNAPKTFQRFMDNIFRDCDFVSCYADDILIFSNNEEEHLDHLRQVLERLCKHGLTINPAKCQLGQPEVTCIGRLFSANGISPLKKNVDRILNLPVPKTVHELRRTIGSFSYYREHIPNIATLLAPLNELIKGHPKKRCHRTFRIFFQET